MSDSGDSQDMEDVVSGTMNKLSKQKRPRAPAKKTPTSGTAALLSADSELFPDADAEDDDNSSSKRNSRKNRRTHISSEKYGIGRFVGLHTPIQMKSKRNTDTSKQEEKRRMCIYCNKRIYTMCKECNTAVCFANTFEKAEESCWYLHHHEPSLIPIPSSLHGTL